MIFNQKLISKLTLSMSVLASSFLFTACEKNEGASISEEIPVEEVLRIVKNLPEVKLVDGSKTKTFTTPEGVTFVEYGSSFSFADAEGPTFSTSEGIVFSEGPNGVIYADITKLGGGGQVIAGKTNLDIALALCFGTGEEGIFDFGFGYDGASTVFGIAGDFEKAIKNDDFEEFFHGVAMYFVFDSKAKGSYKVVDLSKFDEENPTKKAALAVVVDFKKEMYYVSKSGSLNVTGGSINFTGSYYAIDKNEKISVVSGLGTMGCD